MTHHPTQVSRRSVAGGMAWAVPAVAVAAAAPALAVSGVKPPGCNLTDAQLNAGVCDAASIQVTGGRSFSTTGGAVVDASTAMNFALKSTCNYKGSVTVYFHSTSTQLGAAVPPATMTLANGTTYSGKATLGQVGSGGALVGFDMSVTFQWAATRGTVNSTNWAGAVITVPFNWYYTAPDGSVHSCIYALRYTMPGDNSAGLQTMGTPTIVLY